MLDSRKSNPTCQFSEEIALYLYEEMGNDERTEFVGHLGECSTCPNELAAFSTVRSSVQQWRDSEFANLATPKIDIPFGDVRESVQNGGWLASIRTILSAAPVYMKTAGAFASLLLIAVLGWVLMNSLSGESEMAGSNNKTSEPSKKNIDVALPEKPEVAVQTDSASNTSSEKSPEVADETAPVKKAPLKVAYRNRTKTGRTKSKKRITKNRTPRTKKKPNPAPRVLEQPIDRLTEEFAIDKSKDDELTLSDLLDELGSDE